ncbi:hypothetical protein AYX13_02908 [Cryptococcus neoformans]|nr:hypothetical protein AYX13_02908 [Cryptococcus neoformans var. grubii]
MSLYDRQGEEEDFPHLNEDDIEEVLEDDGQRPVGLDDDDLGYGHDEDMKRLGDGIEGIEVIEKEPKENNSWGATALHQDHKSIFALSLHPKFPNPPLAITGGQDDTGFIFCPIPSSSADGNTSTFNSETFLPIRLSGHTDSVVTAAWNFDGDMVATGGMDGRVRVWRRVRKRRGQPLSEEVLNSLEGWRAWEFLTSLETGSEITWLTWHPKGNVLTAGCEDATAWMWNLPSGNTLAVLSSHTFSCTAGLFPPTAKNLLTASLDSSLILWDPRSPTPVWKSNIFLPPNSPELDPSIHGITSLAVSPRGDVVAVGGASGSVKIVSLSKGDVLTTLQGHRFGDSVEALCFVDLANGTGDGGRGLVCVSGGTDGCGFVWDVATGRVRSEIQHDEVITSLAPHPAPNQHLLTTASLDSTLKTWDIRTGILVATHLGHTGLVGGVAVASLGDGTVGVVSAGDEGISMIWRI